MKEGEVTRFALKTSSPPQAEGSPPNLLSMLPWLLLESSKIHRLRAIGTKSQNPKLVFQIRASRVQKWWGGDIFLSFLGKNLNRLTTMGGVRFFGHISLEPSKAEATGWPCLVKGPYIGYSWVTGMLSEWLMRLTFPFVVDMHRNSTLGASQFKIKIPTHSLGWRRNVKSPST